MGAVYNENLIGATLGMLCLGAVVFRPFDQDYFIRIYDDVFLHGHVVEPRKERKLIDALKTIAS